MKINLHTHSNFSLDGEFDVQTLINYFKENDFNIISKDNSLNYQYLDDDKLIETH